VILDRLAQAVREGLIRPAFDSNAGTDVNAIVVVSSENFKALQQNEDPNWEPIE